MSFNMWLYLFIISQSHGLFLETTLCGYGKKDQHSSPRDSCLKSNQVKNFGEDAGFFTDHKIIIADGVGGWRRHGVDPSHYSFEITRYLASNIKASETDLLHHVEKSYENISNKKILGSTTLLYAVLSGNNLHVYNLGDCMLIVVRNNEIIYSTGTQQMQFNFPYQLSSSRSFLPNQGKVDQIELKEGDLVVSGSDGFWDNIFENEIVSIEEIVEFLEKQDLKGILDIVSQRSDDDNYCSPFCKNAKEVAGKNWPGGKVDDTTLAVSWVHTSESSQHSEL